MKEIKFRAWDKDSHQMADEKFCILQFDKIINNSRFILQQFTGLKDKNGKEIYEGDIVKSPKKEYEIVWNNECARWGLLDGVNYPIAIHHEGKTLEIIGNIYENPELLKKGNCGMMEAMPKR